jgi:hypothetical protein
MFARSVLKDAMSVIVLRRVNSVLKVKSCSMVYVLNLKIAHPNPDNLSKITSVKHVKHHVNSALRQVSVYSVHLILTSSKDNVKIRVPLT